MSILFGSEVAGWFGLTVRVVSLPVAVLGLAASQLFIAHGARTVRTDGGQLRGEFSSTTRKMAIYGVAPLTLGCLTAPWTFPIAFGSQWSEAGVYALLLLPGMAAQLLIAPVSGTLQILERPGDQLAWDIARLLLLTGVVLSVGAYTDDPHAVILSISMSMVVAYAALWWRCRSLVLLAEGGRL
jgi:O-antigen/teichoic acid export membrane protein